MFSDNQESSAFSQPNEEMARKRKGLDERDSTEKKKPPKLTALSPSESALKAAAIMDQIDERAPGEFIKELIEPYAFTTQSLELIKKKLTKKIIELDDEFLKSGQTPQEVVEKLTPYQETLEWIGEKIHINNDIGK